MRNKADAIIVALALVPLLVLLPGKKAMSIEQPKYAVVHTDDSVEYRQYQDYLVVETEITGAPDFESAGNEGFRRLFQYIAGANDGGAKISMTAPVIQDKAGAKIAMTAPVAQEASASGWRVAFVVPSGYTIDTAPQPTDQRVYLRQVPGKLVAAIRYSGRWTQANVEKYQAELEASLAAAGVKALLEPVVARYNGPFTLPFLRRNEIVVAVDRTPAASN